MNVNEEKEKRVPLGVASQGIRIHVNDSEEELLDKEYAKLTFYPNYVDELDTYQLLAELGFHWGP